MEEGVIVLGMTSQCVRFGDIVEKRYFPNTEENKSRGVVINWNNELKVLKLFKGEKHIPKLLDVKGNVMYLEYCGETLTKDNLPSDWEVQCAEIEAIQRKHNVFHMDIFCKNITVKNGIIYLIDWGLFTTTKNKYDIKTTIINLINS